MASHWFSIQTARISMISSSKVLRLQRIDSARIFGRSDHSRALKMLRCHRAGHHEDTRAMSVLVPVFVVSQCITQRCSMQKRKSKKHKSLSLYLFSCLSCGKYHIVAHWLHISENISDSHSSSQLPPVFWQADMATATSYLLMHHNLRMDFQNLVAGASSVTTATLLKVSWRRTQLYGHYQEATIGKPFVKHSLHMFMFV